MTLWSPPWSVLDVLQQDTAAYKPGVAKTRSVVVWCEPLLCE
jgi:hypothetical protein